MPVTELAPAQLRELARLVAEELDARRSGRPRLVDSVELALILGIGEATVRRRKTAGELPYIQAGRRVLYDPQAVIVALSQNEKRPGA